jgi:hypothetical protein
LTILAQPRITRPVAYAAEAVYLRLGMCLQTRSLSAAAACWQIGDPLHAAAGQTVGVAGTIPEPARLARTSFWTLLAGRGQLTIALESSHERARHPQPRAAIEVLRLAAIRQRVADEAIAAAALYASKQHERPSLATAHD